ncbi:serine/threonine protein kinase [Luteolibacter sp. AS25]|uniref:serine/threonine protein kinase n=1 Tax=Luteolibacter sp. AS25 TaxID=3135776 RepID=UPI00398B254C
MSDSENHVTFSAPILEEVEALFPSYDILRLIACGGMGAVYHATQRSLDRPVAIKLLPREFSTDEAFRTGFEAEAKAMAKLNHPNLIGVYDFGEIGGMLFIVMEYVDGNSLFEAANGEPVEQSAAIAIISAVCHGLANAHENGILHRDIKPANILLDASLTPKISDFGLARSLETQIQEGEQIFGTPGYTAPEILEPPHSFDHRADIFSVGVMLYELLTGNLPTTYSPPASNVSGCNIRLDRVIQRAMHPDPNSRYNSATELAADLQSIGSSSAKALVTSGSAASRTRPSTVKLKSKSSSGIGTTIMLLLLLGGAAYAYYHFKILPKKEVTPPAESTGLEPEKRIIEIVPATPSSTVIPANLDSGVDSLFGKATEITKGRLGPAIREYEKDTEENYTAFASSFENGISELSDRAIEISTNAYEKNAPKWNGRVPAQLPKKIRQFEKLTVVHSTYSSLQNENDEQLLAELESGAEFYVSILEEDLKNLEKDGNQQAIGLIKAEINSVQKDLSYFAEKFMGSLPVMQTGRGNEDEE